MPRSALYSVFSTLQPCNATPRIHRGGQLVLLDGAFFGKWTNEFYREVDMVLEGTIQAGLPEGAFSIGAWGAAAGDVTGDGANDLLLGGVDGVLRLCINDALRHPLRTPREHPTTLHQRLQEMRIVSVRVTGRIGVLGAEVRLADAGGRVVARRVIGSAVLTGCRGPDTVNLVARPPGRYRLTVRFADGTKHTRDLELDAEPRTVVVLRHPTVEIRDSGSHPASAGASPEEHGPTACPGQRSQPSTTTRRGGDE